jgi:hypothetical protein
LRRYQYGTVPYSQLCVYDTGDKLLKIQNYSTLFFCFSLSVLFIEACHLFSALFLALAQKQSDAKLELALARKQSDVKLELDLTSDVKLELDLTRDQSDVKLELALDRKQSDVNLELDLTRKQSDVKPELALDRKQSDVKPELARARTAFQDGNYDVLFSILEGKSFDSCYHQYLQEIWYKAHYMLVEKDRGRPLGKKLKSSTIRKESPRNLVRAGGESQGTTTR